MASFFCHAFAVTKRFRLERIVRLLPGYSECLLLSKTSVCTAC